MHLAVTVSALQIKRGFVVVLEDTSEFAARSKKQPRGRKWPAGLRMRSRIR